MSFVYFSERQQTLSFNKTPFACAVRAGEIAFLLFSADNDFLIKIGVANVIQKKGTIFLRDTMYYNFKLSLHWGVFLVYFAEVARITPTSQAV